MDEYDNTFNKYDYTIDVYQNDIIQMLISEFTNKVSITEYEIEVGYQKLSQIKEDKKLSENIKNTVIKLRNALEILEPRMVTNIGGKVAYYVVPEKYDEDLGYRPKWILIQVWRGYR